jgi:hypothetical protein
MTSKNEILVLYKRPKSMIAATENDDGSITFEPGAGDLSYQCGTCANEMTFEETGGRPYTQFDWFPSNKNVEDTVLLR